MVQFAAFLNTTDLVALAIDGKLVALKRSIGCHSGKPHRDTIHGAWPIFGARVQAACARVTC